jgi:hypothetical protein
MTAIRQKLLLIVLAVASGCVKEPPPRTVSEFVDDPILLEAALLRCTENRAESRYEAECINVREAVKQVEAKQQAAQREELELLSQRKRENLRRTQQAAAEARRRAREAEERRKEAAYLAQFGELPPAEDTTPDELQGNAPIALVPDAPPEATQRDQSVPALPTAGSNAPVSESAPVESASAEPVEQELAPQPTPDLSTIRDELKRRNEEGGNN